MTFKERQYTILNLFEAENCKMYVEDYQDHPLKPFM